MSFYEYIPALLLVVID